MNLDDIIAKNKKLNFLKSPAFMSLPAEKQNFLLGCLEDALFWKNLEKNPDAANGFKFLAAAFGLHRAEVEANAKGLQGAEREKMIQPHLELHSMFNPHYGIEKA